MRKTISNTSLTLPNTTQPNPNQHQALQRASMFDQGSLRPTSPNSKTKIKLVSPFRQKGNTQVKENHAPVSFNNTRSPTNKSLIQIQLGGKANKLKQNHHSQIPIYQHKQPVHPFTSHNFKKNILHIDSQPILMSEVQRSASPTKIVINNKSFDINAIKSRVVLVTPLKSKEQLKESVIKESIRRSAHEELVIQQENTLQDLKQSYQEQMRQIQQLQSQIQENNIQIKQLLRSSNVSRHLASSKHSSSQENFAEENTSQKQKLTSKQFYCPDKNVISKLIKCDQVSVQTDFAWQPQESVRSESRYGKWAVTRNKQCQINLTYSHHERQTNSEIKQKANNTQSQFRPSIKQSRKEGHMAKEVKEEFGQQAIQSIIPVSQMSIPSMHSSKVSLSQAPNDQLAVSRAESQHSIISQSPSSFRQIYGVKNQQLPNKSKVSVKPAQRQVEKTHNSSQPINTSSTGVESTKAIMLVGGKRRINNSIYL